MATHWVNLDQWDRSKNSNWVSLKGESLPFVALVPFVVVLWWGYVYEICAQQPSWIWGLLEDKSYIEKTQRKNTRMPGDIVDTPNHFRIVNYDVCFMWKMNFCFFESLKCLGSFSIYCNQTVLYGKCIIPNTKFLCIHQHFFVSSSNMICFILSLNIHISLYL